MRSRKSIGDSVLRGSSLATGANPPLEPAEQPKTNPAVPTLGDIIPGAPDLVIPAPPKAVQDLTDQQRAEQSQTQLLDFLLGS